MEPIVPSIASYIAINAFPVFAPLKVVAFLETEEEDAISCQPFTELITEQMEKNLPYILALVQDEGSSKTFCFDAVNLAEWNEIKPTNPTTNGKISHIFLFALSHYTGTESDCFQYLGTSKEVDIFHPKIQENNCFIRKPSYIEIDTSIMFAPLTISSYLDLNEIEPLRKMSYSKLINEQKKKNLPYLLAVTQDENSTYLQYFDALSLQNNKELIKNPVFFFLLSSNISLKNDDDFEDDRCFLFVGNSNDKGNKKEFIDTLLNPSEASADALYAIYEAYCQKDTLESNPDEAVKWLKRAAVKNHVEAQNFLGNLYYNGEGLNQNHGEAFKFFKLAAKQGHAEAQYSLGLCYFEGHGVNENIAEAVKWWKLAAKQGVGDAQHMLASCYAQGTGIQQDYKEAVRLWLLSSEQGNLKSQCLLGICYNKGVGIDQDFKKGIELLKKAIAQNSVVAKELLEIFYLQNEVLSFDIIMNFAVLGLKKPGKAQYYLGTVFHEKKNFKTALLYFQRSVARQNADAHYMLGNYYFQGNGVDINIATAIEWWTVAANYGNSLAQYELGYSYFHGRGVEQDIQKAHYYFKRSADQGYMLAESYLGTFYYEGWWVKQNYEEAFKWFDLAAKQGDSVALYQTSFCYLKGHGVKKNMPQAMDYLKRSAELGYVLAECHLGMIYYDGEGLKKNFQQAFKWLELAAKQGNFTAHYHLSLYYSQGKAVKKDMKKSEYHLNLSAELGYAKAQHCLGMICLTENAGKGSLEPAKKWFKLAADQGFEPSKEMMKNFSRNNTNK